MQSGNNKQLSTTAEIIAQAKLTSLKIILIQAYPDIDENIHKQFEDANSCAEFWVLLFKHKLFKHYFKLKKAGISATASELNEVYITDNTSPWYWLAENETGCGIFLSLLNQQIKPNPKILDCRCYDNKKNAWELLLSNNRGRPVFNSLINQNILPLRSLSARSWNLLSDQTGLFKNLMDHGIFPNQDDLSVPNSCNETGWYNLSESQAGRDIFKILIGAEPEHVFFTTARLLNEPFILPNPKDMFTCPYTFSTRNAWDQLCYDNQGMEIRQKLLNDSNDIKIALAKIILTQFNIEDAVLANLNSMPEIWQLVFGKSGLGIYQQLNSAGISPTAQELNYLDDKLSVSSAWFNLCDHKNLGIIEELFKKKIYPNQNTMSKLHYDTNDDGTNDGLLKQAWHLLLTTEQGLKAFDTLLAANIYPPKDFLSGRIRINGKPLCYWMSCDTTTLAVLKKLIKAGIYPEAKFLSEINHEYNDNTWLMLSSTEQGKDIFLELLNSNIWPDKKDLSVGCANINAWRLLMLSSFGHLNILKLFNKDIYPDQDDLSFACKKQGMNTWYVMLVCGLASGREIYNHLQNRGILPTTKDLALCTKYNNTNIWYSLFSRNLYKNVKHLLKKNIYPTPHDLAVCSIEEDSNSWHILSSDSFQGFGIMARLFKRDIFPSQADMDKKNKSGKSVWDLLLQNISGDMYDVFQQLKNIKLTVNKFNLPDCSVTRLISRDNAITYYSFLYLFYINLVSAHPLPLELWKFITAFAFVDPLFHENEYLNGLKTDENRQAFLKYHAVESLNLYSDRFFRLHGDRAKSLAQEIREIKNSGKVVDIINKQYLMSKYDISLYKNPVKHYQKPLGLVNKVTSDDFQEILKEGVRLGMK